MATYTIEIPTDKEDDLRKLADSSGSSIEQVAQQFVLKGLANINKNQAAIEVLRAFRVEDAEEQKETLEYLEKALNEDRFGQRKVFP